MNVRLVRDLLIESVRVDREMKEHVGPRPLKAMQLHYVHDFADMAGWGKKLNDKECQLTKEDADPYGPKGQFSREFWEQYNREPAREELDRAMMVQRWMTLLDDDRERRALMAWLRSKAGGKAFRRWCFGVEGISQKTGLKRKDRALAKIEAQLPGWLAQNDNRSLFMGLQDDPEIGDELATLAAGADDEGLNHWRAPDATPEMQIVYETDRSGDCRVIVSPADFSWAQKRNEHRRKMRERRAREAAKRQKAAA